MKYLAIVLIVLCGCLMISTPFFYSLITKVNYEYLSSSFITYIPIIAGFMALNIASKVAVKNDLKIESAN